MATATLAPVSMQLSANVTSNVVGTFSGVPTGGIKVTQVKFENNTSTGVYLSSNGNGTSRYFRIYIQGSNSGQELLANTLIDRQDHSLYNTIGSNGVVTVSSSSVLTGSIQIRCDLYRSGGSAAFNAITGWINQTKITLTYITKPTVSAGDYITKAQMDAVRTWKGSGTVVTQGSVATATHGNTYKSGLVAGTTTFDDAWYNSIV